MERTETNHYATLGLHEKCTAEQIRAAYRVLAKQFHPDLNPGSSDAILRTQQLNAAYEILSDPDRRRAYDEVRSKPTQRNGAGRGSKAAQNISQDALLRIDELLRGTTLEVRLNDPANPGGNEIYELIVPPGTAPGTRFRISRNGPFSRSFVVVRVRARPDFRFKVRGSDLKCDLRISNERARQGGFEMVQGLSGRVRVAIPRNVERGEIIRIPGEGLPKARSGRGDLLVRIVYRPEVKISRRTTR